MYHYFKPNVDTRKLTWNLKITPLKEKLIFQTFIFRFHVSFRGSISYNSSPSGFRSQYQGPAGRSLDVAATIYPVTKCHWNQPLILTHLVGGNSNIFYFHPNPWGNDPKWRAYFSKGLVQPPTSKSCFWRSMFIFSRDTCLENPTLGESSSTKLAYKLSLSCLLSLFYRPRPSWYPMAMNGARAWPGAKKMGWHSTVDGLEFSCTKKGWWWWWWSK